MIRIRMRIAYIFRVSLMYMYMYVNQPNYVLCYGHQLGWLTYMYIAPGVHNSTCTCSVSSLQRCYDFRVLGYIQKVPLSSTAVMHHYTYTCTQYICTSTCVKYTIHVRTVHIGDLHPSIPSYPINMHWYRHTLYCHNCCSCFSEGLQ